MKTQETHATHLSRRLRTVGVTHISLMRVLCAQEAGHESADDTSDVEAHGVDVHDGITAHGVESRSSIPAAASTEDGAHTHAHKRARQTSGQV